MINTESTNGRIIILYLDEHSLKTRKLERPFFGLNNKEHMSEDLDRICNSTASMSIESNTSHSAMKKRRLHAKNEALEHGCVTPERSGCEDDREPYTLKRARSVQTHEKISATGEALKIPPLIKRIASFWDTLDESSETKVDFEFWDQAEDIERAPGIGRRATNWNYIESAHTQVCSQSYTKVECSIINSSPLAISNVVEITPIPNTHDLGLGTNSSVNHYFSTPTRKINTMINLPPSLRRKSIQRRSTRKDATLVGRKLLTQFNLMDPTVKTQVFKSVDKPLRSKSLEISIGTKRDCINESSLGHHSAQ